jgi:hypothetical protein
MNKLFTSFSFLLRAACNHPSDKKSDSQDEAKTKAISEIKVPVYAWMVGPGRATDKKINADVFPGPNSIARKIVLQEWDKWNLDAFYPMNYNDFYLKGTKWIGEVSNEGVIALNNRKDFSK